MNRALDPLGLFLLFLGVLVLPPNSHADSRSRTSRDFSKMTFAQLDALFASGVAHQVPCGPARGKVLLVVDSLCPKTRAALMNTLWKGKVFFADGRFTNQWVGFKAIEAKAVLGQSWADGGPCIVMDYPGDAGVFSNMRDELREVGQGMFLGRFYERCPSPKCKGYFLLVFPKKCTTTQSVPTR